MQQLIEKIRRHYTARTCHGFLVVGNVGDLFLDSDGHDVASADELLARSFANHGYLRLEAHAGLTCKDTAVAKLVRNIIGIEEESISKDAVSKAKAALDAPVDDLTIIPNAMMAAPELLRILRESNQELLLHIPYLDNLSPSGPMTDRSGILIAELLTKLARDCVIGNAGHLVVASARSVADVHAQLVERASGFLSFTVDLPNEATRTRVASFVRHACQTAKKDAVSAKNADQTPLQTGDAVADGWSKASVGDTIMLVTKEGKLSIKVSLRFDEKTLGLDFSDAKKTGMKNAVAFDQQPISIGWGFDGSRIRAERSDLFVDVSKESFFVTKGDILTFDRSKPITAVRPKPEPPPPPPEAMPEGLSHNEVGRLTGGLMTLDIVRCVRLQHAAKQPLDFTTITHMKRELVEAAYGHLVAFRDTPYGFEGIGGLRSLKEELRRVVGNIRAGNVNAVPMGIGLMGPPGTGKTAIAEALAHECGFAFAEILNQRSMWNGQTEANTQAIIRVVRSLAPIVVFKDEADQEDAGRDGPQGDSGVSARVRQAWMKFTSDPTIQGRVLMLNASNRPDLIDPALKRSGRMDMRFAVLMPNIEALEEIFRVMFEVQLRIPTTIKNFRPFAELASKCSGADVKTIIQRAYMLSNGAPVDAQQLKLAIDDFRPSADQATIRKMSQMALQEVSFNSFMTSEEKALL